MKMKFLLKTLRLDLTLLPSYFHSILVVVLFLILTALVFTLYLRKKRLRQLVACDFPLWAGCNESTRDSSRLAAITDAFIPEVSW